MCLREAKNKKNSTLKNKQYPLEKNQADRELSKINRKSKYKPEGLNEKRRLNKN